MSTLSLQNQLFVTYLLAIAPHAASSQALDSAAPSDPYSIIQQALGDHATNLVVDQILIEDLLTETVHSWASKGRFILYHEEEKTLTRVPGSWVHLGPLLNDDLYVDRQHRKLSLEAAKSVWNRAQQFKDDTAWRKQLENDTLAAAKQQLRSRAAVKVSPLGPAASVVVGRYSSAIQSAAVAGAALTPTAMDRPWLPKELSDYIEGLMKSALADGLAKHVGTRLGLGLRVFFEAPEDLAEELVDTLIDHGLTKVIGAGASAGLTLFFDSSEIVSEESEMAALWKAKREDLKKLAAAQRAAAQKSAETQKQGGSDEHGSDGFSFGLHPSPNSSASSGGSDEHESVHPHGGMRFSSDHPSTSSSSSGSNAPDGTFETLRTGDSDPGPSFDQGNDVEVGIDPPG